MNGRVRERERVCVYVCVCVCELGMEGESERVRACEYTQLLLLEKRPYIIFYVSYV